MTERGSKMDYSQKLAEQFSTRADYVANIISLLDEGNTIPFIARYRKEMHGSMDDQLIREISERLAYLRSLDERREEVRGPKLTFNLPLGRLSQPPLVGFNFPSSYLSQQCPFSHIFSFRS